MMINKAPFLTFSIGDNKYNFNVSQIVGFGLYDDYIWLSVATSNKKDKTGDYIFREDLLPKDSQLSLYKSLSEIFKPLDLGSF